VPISFSYTTRSSHCVSPPPLLPSLTTLSRGGKHRLPQRMQAKEEALKPYIEQIDEIDASVADLEAVVGKLDLYTRRMEAQFRVLLAE
jgi:hypothetical protein